MVDMVAEKRNDATSFFVRNGGLSATTSTNGRGGNANSTTLFLEKRFHKADGVRLKNASTTFV